LYFAVEGVLPFGPGEPRETLAAVVADPPRPPRLAGPLGPALLGVLAKQPALRPDAARLRQQLGPLADGDATGRWAAAAPPAKEAQAPAGATLRLPGEPPATTRQRPAQARWPGAPVRAWLVLATALLLLGLAATLATALGRGRVRTPRPGRRAAPPRPVPSPRRPRQAAWRSATGQSRPRPTTTRSGWPSRS